MESALNAPGQTDHQVTDFFQSWALYESIVSHDFMEHSTITSAICTSLNDRPPHFSVLDLGCGDSSVMASTLKDLPVSHYTGVDLTEAALDIAKVAPSPAYPCSWEQRDMLDFLRSASQTYDVIVATFALHHLRTEKKQEWLHAASACLNPGGALYLVDTCREAHETREDAVERYLKLIESWSLTQDGWQIVANHMRGFDFPETRDWMTRAITLAKMTFEVIYDHPLRLQMGYVCRPV